LSSQTAIELVKKLHPQAAENAELIIQLTEESHERLGIGFDVTADEYARALADKSGAFPYDGPVGNGMTKAHYQERFREMAAEHLMILREMATPTDGANE